jgi:Tfp pilus assembly protein PilF
LIYTSFEPEAEKTCEELLTMALQTDPGHPEALQALASVRMSQQRPEEAKQCLEQAWTAWKDLDLGGHTFKKLMTLSFYLILSL